MRPESPTGLYWSIHGEVACKDHAPELENPRWSIEGLVPIKVLPGRKQWAEHHQRQADRHLELARRKKAERR